MNGIALMYHCVYCNSTVESGFQNQGADIYKVSRCNFENQVGLLANSNVPIVLTFDDGGISFYTLIAPILEKYSCKGIFFIATKYIGTEGFLSEEQIIDLKCRGHIIGSHSHSHPVDMSRLSRAEIYEEWRQSIKILSDILGENVRYASIPNGFCSKDIIETALLCGITCLYTSEPSTKRRKYKNMVYIGRFAVQRKMSSEYIFSIVNSNSRRIKIRVKWYVLKLVKLILGTYYLKMRRIVLKMNEV